MSDRSVEFDKKMAEIPNMSLQEIVYTFPIGEAYSPKDAQYEQYRQALLNRAQALITQIGSGQVLSRAERILDTASGPLSNPLPESIYFVKNLALRGNVADAEQKNSTPRYIVSPIRLPAPELSLVAWNHLARLSLQPFWQYVVANLQDDLDNLDEKTSFRRLRTWLDLYRNVFSNKNALKNAGIVEKEPDSLMVLLETFRDRHSQFEIDDQTVRFETALKKRPISAESILDAGAAIKSMHMIFTRLMPPVYDGEQLPASVEASQQREKKYSETIEAMNEALNDLVYEFVQTSGANSHSNALSAIVQYTTKGSRARKELEAKIAERKSVEEAEVARAKSEADAKKASNTIMGLSVGLFALIVVAVVLFFAALVAVLVVVIRTKSRKAPSAVSAEAIETEDQPAQQAEQNKDDGYTLM